jgi:hypothetical protein
MLNFSYLEGITQIEGVSEQGTEENIWTKGGRS